MKYNNEQVIFRIPNLDSEWIFPFTLYYSEPKNRFYVCSEDLELKAIPICKATIFHTMIGHINKFDVTCRDFNTKDIIFEWILEPILRKYCDEKIIDLRFDYL
jgi:hypothetical protein